MSAGVPHDTLTGDHDHLLNALRITRAELARVSREHETMRNALRDEIRRRFEEYEGWAGTLDNAVNAEFDRILAADSRVEDNQ